jgi:hypothetical protein
MSGRILCGREDAIATVTLSNPGKLNAIDLAMWQEAGRDCREIVGRRAGALRVVLRAKASRRLPPVATSRSSPSARYPGACDGVSRAGWCCLAGGVRLSPPDDRPDAGRVHRRWPGDRRAMRPAHLWRVVTLRRADQQARLLDVSRRNGRAAASGRGGDGARNPARRAHSRRRRGPGQGPRHACRRRCRRRCRSLRQCPAHLRWRAAGRHAGTSSGCAACSTMSRSASRNCAPRSPFSIPKTTAKACRRSSKSASRIFAVADRRSPGRRAAVHPTASWPASRSARRRKGASKWRPAVGAPVAPRRGAISMLDGTSQSKAGR